MINSGKIINTPVLVKPLINLFAGEKYSRNFRQFLSESNNHKKYGSFRELLDTCAEEFEGLNKEAIMSYPGEHR